MPEFFRKKSLIFLTVFILTSGFFIFVQTPSAKGAWDTNVYNKPFNGTLTATEWNNLFIDFVNRWQPVEMQGPLTIGTSTPSSLTVNGTINATNFSGAYTGTLGAQNVSSGAFGSNTGGGNYSFPGNVGIGTSTVTDLLTIRSTTANPTFISVGGSDDNSQMGIWFGRGPTYNNNFGILYSANNAPTGWHDFGPNLVAFSAGAGVSSIGINATTATTPIIFYTNDWTERVRIIPNTGNLGIGIKTPAARLDVAGSDSPSVRLTNTANLGGTAWAGTTTHAIDFYNSDPSGPGIFSAIRAIGSPGSGVPNAGVVEHDLTFWTGGYTYSIAERLRITNNGNVGIGTTSPISKLTLTGGDFAMDHNKSIIINSAASSTLLLGNYFSGGFAYGTGQTASLAVEGDVKADRLCIEEDCKAAWSEIVFSGGGGQWITSGNNIYNANSGNVGIGTSSPQYNLHVYSASNPVVAINSPSTAGTNSLVAMNDLGVGRSMYYTVGGSAAAGTSFGVNKASAGYIYTNNMPLMVGTANNNTLTLGTNDLARITILGGGNVGIGLTNPGYKLTVADAASPRVMVQDTTNNVQSFLRSVDTSGSVGTISNHNFGIYTSDAERVTVTSSGNVGIGTTNPAGILDVVGSNANINGSVKTLFKAIGDGTNYGTGIALVGMGTGAKTWSLISANDQIGTRQNGSFNIWDVTAGVNRMTVNTDGNVGIAVSNPTTKLQVSGGTGNAISAGGGQLAGLNSTPLNSDHAVPLGYLQANYTPSGTAPGGVGSGTSGQTLRHDGTSWVANSVLYNNGTNVGVGTTSPLAKLDVAGTFSAGPTGNISIASNGRVTVAASAPDLTIGGGQYLGFSSSGSINNLTTINSSGSGTGTLGINSGQVRIGGDAGGKVSIINTYSASVPILALKGAAGQSAELLNIVNDSNNQVFSIDSQGAIAKKDLSPGSVHNVASYYGDVTGAGSAGTGVAASFYSDNSSNLRTDYGSLSFYAPTFSGGNPQTDFVVNLRNGVTAPAEKFRVTSSGNVGIGTTAPGTKLTLGAASGNQIDVAGGQLAGLNSTPLNSDHAVPLGYLQANYAPIGTGAGSAFVQGGNSFGAAAVLGTNDNNLLNIETNNAVRMTVAAGGNVGIGTTNPTVALDVNGQFNVSSATYPPLNMTRTNALTNIIQSGAQFKGKTTADMVDGYGIDLTFAVEDSANVNNFLGRIGAQRDGADNSGALVFGTRSAGTNIDHMIIRSSGNVGIGTTNPATKLDITNAAGSTHVFTVTNTSSSGGFSGSFNLVAPNLSNGQTLFMNIGKAASNYNRAAFTYNHSSDGSTSNRLSFGFFGADNLLNILASGNVGIGTTAPGSRLTVKSPTGNVFAQQILSSDDQNLFTFEQKATDGAGRFDIYNASAISTIKLDTAGDTYFNGGNVGIGTTTPNTKLFVNGGTGNAISAGGGQLAGLNSTPLNSDHAVPLGYLQANYTPSGTAAGGVGNGTSGQTLRHDGTSWVANSTLYNSGTNIGIGTTNPGLPLVVIGSDINNGQLRVQGGSTMNASVNAGQIFVGGSSAYGSIAYSFGAGDLIFDNSYDSPGADIRFRTRTSGTPLDVLTILGTGHVGFGTSLPVYRLDVVSATTTEPGLRVSGGSTIGSGVGTQQGQIVLGTAASAQGFITYNGGGGDLIFDNSYNNDNGDIAFRTKTTGTAVNAITIKGSGNVGIGTTAPDALFDVNGLMRANNYYSSRADGDIYLYHTTTSDNTYFGSESGPTMVLLGSGNVGIGTTTPNTKLFVNGGTGNAIGAGGGQVAGLNSTPLNSDHAVPLGYLQANYTPSGTAPGGVGSGTNGQTLRHDGTSWVGNSVLFNDGTNVGIGTTNPGAAFHISGNEAGIRITRTGNEPYLQLNTDGAQLRGLTGGGLRITDGGAGTEWLRVNASGNVGIGTTAPSQALDIRNGSNPSIEIDNSATSGYSQLLFSNTAGGGRGQIFVPGASQASYGGANSLNFLTTGAYPIAFMTNGASTPQVYIQSGGNVGIGTTNPTAKLDIGLTSTTGTYFRGGGTGSSSEARRLELTATTTTNIGDTHIFDAISATGVISFSTTGSERMRIVGGNVGIGTTSPITKLAVSGGTGNTINVGGGQIAGLNSTPLNSDHAVPLGYLQANYSASSGSLWGGTQNGTIWNGTTGAGNVGIGTTNPLAKLQIEGGVIYKRTPVADVNYTVLADDYIIGYTSISTNRTVTLPDALCTPGRFFVVVDESGNASASAKIIIDPEGTTPIIGLQTLPLEDSFNSVYVFCGNLAWYIL